jgi:hypothetical protein
LAALVPRSPSSVPPAAMMVTVPPLTCPARSAAPLASSALCETSTIPTVAVLIAYPGALMAYPRVIVLHHVFRPDNTVQILEVGAAIPWYACALGHAIVAHLPAAQRTRALAGDLAPLTGRTKSTRAALNRALAQVRQRGYAVEDQEATVGDAGIAAPILSRDGTVAGAIGVVGAADRLLVPGTRNELVRAVAEAARAVSRDLGAGRGGVVLSALS